MSAPERDVRRRMRERVEVREAADEVAWCTGLLACDCDSCAMAVFRLSDWDEREDWLGYAAGMLLGEEPAS